MVFSFAHGYVWTISYLPMLLAAFSGSEKKAQRKRQLRSGPCRSSDLDRTPIRGSFFAVSTLDRHPRIISKGWKVATKKYNRNYWIHTHLFLCFWLVVAGFGFAVCGDSSTPLPAHHIGEEETFIHFFSCLARSARSCLVRMCNPKEIGWLLSKWESFVLVSAFFRPSRELRFLWFDPIYLLKFCCPHLQEGAPEKHNCELFNRGAPRIAVALAHPTGRLTTSL